MFKRDMGVGATLAIIFVGLLGVNLAAAIALRSVKYDLTDDKLYTLSDGSEKLLSKLDDAVKVKLFYSRRAAGGVPQIKAYADRTISLLKQFEARSAGKLSLVVLDPEPDSDTEEEAMKAGMTAVPVKADENLYLGLTARSETGQEKNIPFLDPQREAFLEYDVAQLISGISHPEKKTIGVLSPLGVMGGPANDPMARMQGTPPQEPWVLVSQLKQTYNVKEVSATTGEIDSTIDVLIVIHPKKLPDQTEYAIDQFIVKGGRAIILFDGMCEFEQHNSRSMDMQGRFKETYDSTLPRLFKAWGIDNPSGKVIADKDLGVVVRFGNQQAQYPIWMMIGTANANQQEIISSNMEQLLFESAAVMKKASDQKYTVTPLIESGPSAMEMDSFLLKLGPNPEQMNKDFVAGKERLGIAYKVTGKFSTAFPEGKPKSVLPESPNGPNADGPKPADENPMKDHVAQGDKETNVLLFSDVDFITEGVAYAVQPFFGQKIIQTRNDNLNLINNAIGFMTGSDELIGLRTRGKSARPFTTVDNMERKARQQFNEELQQLQKKSDDVKRKIEELERGKAEGGQKAILSAEQKVELEKLRKERVETERNLREVKRSLRKDIERKGFELKLLNTGIMPMLVILAAFLPLAWRSYRMRSRRG